MNHAVDSMSALNIEKINRIAIRMLGLAMLYAAMDFSLLLALFYAGMASGVVVTAFGIVATGFVTGFYLMIKTGANRAFKDPGMAVSQVLAAAMTQIGFLMAAPEVGIVFLVNMFSTLMFGLVALNPRQFFRLWLIVAAAIAVAFFFVGDRIGFPNSTGLAQALMCILFIFTLGQSVYLAGVISNFRLKLSRNNQALTVALKTVEEMASRDALTDILNRRALLEILEIELAAFKRKGTPFCIAVIDLDHFKQINDSFGHAVGDEVLKTFVRLAHYNMRVPDRAARYGGDEFVVVLTDTVRDIAAGVLERVRTGVAQYDWNAVAPGLTVSVSIGITAIKNDDTIARALERADSALYAAKSGGRNSVSGLFEQPAAR
jgi:diguanylate cyclase (GGDEF)-like protein